VRSIPEFIDHTNLNQDAVVDDIIKLCEEAVKFGFAAVCVNPIHVELVSSIIKNEKSKVCTVIGFPLGADTSEMKFAETRFLVHQGAEELDMVLNVGALKQGEIGIVEDEIDKVVKASNGRCVKVIIETCLLSKAEKVLACNIAREKGANFIKTSTGYSFGGATIEDVKLIRQTLGDDMGVKASGGIKTLPHLQLMVEVGANRIGTSSGVHLVT